MKRLLGWPFEVLHILGMAIFFAVSGALTLLSAPNWLAKITKTSADAARDFHHVGSMVGRHAWMVAGAAVLGAVIAPYARGDGKKLVAWIRVTCAVAALILVIVIWYGAENGPRFDTAEGGRHAASVPWRSDQGLTPVNGLLIATGLNLALAAFAISGGAGGKKAKADGGKEK